MDAGLPSVVVVDGCRTPFVKANGVFRDLTSYDLARLALKGLQQKTRIDPDLVDRVIMGSGRGVSRRRRSW